MSKGSNKFLLALNRPILLVIIAVGLFVSCSNDQDSQSLTRQKVDNPIAANDRSEISNNKSNQLIRTNSSVQPLDKKTQITEDSEHTDSNNYQAKHSDDRTNHLVDAVVFQGNENGFVEWQAPSEVAYSTTDVVVTAPNGERLKRSYSPGEPIALDKSLSDGLYLWESVVTPELDQYVREEMAIVRQSGNLQKEQELIQKLRNQGSIPTMKEAQENRQSGAFIVKDGVATSIKVANKAAEQLQREDG